MASAKKSLTHSKTCWCLGALGTAYNQKGMHVMNVKPCRYGADACYNAQSQGEIKEESFISNWATRNKADIDLGKLE